MLELFCGKLGDTTGGWPKAVKPSLFIKTVFKLTNINKGIIFALKILFTLNNFG